MRKLSILLLSFSLFCLPLPPLVYSQSSKQDDSPKPSEQLQSAIDLLTNTGNELDRLRELSETLQNEIAASKKGLETLETLRTAQEATFVKQSQLLAVSNQSLKRWKTAAICGIPLGIAAGLLTGFIISK